jgi:sugar phosphate isomerase/epimerase
MTIDFFNPGVCRPGGELKMPAVTACATLGYAALDIAAALDAIASMRFSRVEITELGSYCRHFPYLQADGARVRAMLAARGLTPVAMNVSTSRLVNGQILRLQLSQPGQAREVLAYAAWFLRQAQALGVGVVMLPVGPRKLDAGWQMEMKASCAVLRSVADIAADIGIGLNLEAPHLYQLTDTMEHVKAILAELDRPAVGVTVDSSHWGIIGYDLDAFFDWLGPRLRHVHLRDSAGGDTRDFEQDLERTPGKGGVDFAAFGKALDRAGYTGEVSLELEHRHADLQAIAREFQAGIAHLKRCGWKFPATA